MKTAPVNDAGSSAAERAVARASALAKAGEAAQLRRLLDREPLPVESLCAVSYVAFRHGHLEAAQECSARAVVLRPDDAALHFMHAGLLKARGLFAACLAAYDRALALAPEYVDAWISRGVVLRAGGRTDEALECYRRALQLAPGNVAATINVGNVLQDRGDLPGAEAAFREALARSSDSAEAHLNLGRLLNATGRALEAIEHLRRGLELRPTDLGAALLLAGVLRDVGAGEAAIPIYEHCLKLDARSTDAHLGISAALRQRGLVTDAMASARRAIALNPRDPQAYFALADALIYAGESGEARRILEAAEWSNDLPVRNVSSYLLYSNYFDSLDAGQVFARHRDYGRLLEASRERPAHGNMPDPGRRLRIGYLSYDLRQHPVASFVEPVLARRSDAFHVTCYFTRAVGDAVTERLKSHADAFVYCRNDTDLELARRIRADGIDILVDLSGHTGGNRMTLLTLGAAPIQITWLGYPTTTGLESVRYRITDHAVDPAGAEAYNVERLIRLPGSYYCYRPAADAPEVQEPPCGRQAWVTFGSFNHLAKVTDATVALWTGVLTAVPESRLLLKARALTDDGVKQRLADRFAAAGLPKHRLILAEWKARPDHHLALYGDVDIALDTFPYNGATTTCEALWMGVPVVSLSGATHASRMGRSILGAAGQDAWVARTPEEFRAIASRLAADRPALGTIRRSMRDRLRASALMDEPAFVAGLEAAYRQAWVDWCASR